jgi:type III secretory pathway component EscR
VNDQILVKKFINSAYSYYKEYLKQRKLDEKEYSYEEFAKKKNEEGTSRYLEAISNPIKHK